MTATNLRPTCALWGGGGGDLFQSRNGTHLSHHLSLWISVTHSFFYTASKLWNSHIETLIIVLIRQIPWYHVCTKLTIS